ncbi:MAG TPA: FtsX-like permease family protein [Anaerolineae bacterium]|nr:FtsX-like permease family protein [Anaerolineae bacterium]
MLMLAMRNLRARPTRTLLTALAIALGVGMIFATRIVSVTINLSAREAREGQLAGADLEVVSANRASLDARRADEIAARPDVAAAAPVYRKPEGRQAALDADPNSPASLITTFEGTGLLLLGVDPAHVLTPYELTAGSFFSAPDAREVWLPDHWAIQNGVGVGGKVTLVTGDQTNDFVVAGLLKDKDVLGQPTAWIPLATLQAAFDTPNAASAFLVRLKPGVARDAARDALQADLGSLFIVTSVEGGASNRPLFGLLLDYALPFAGIAILFSGAFLVYNAFAITLTERRREIGQLRTLGMTRGQVLIQTLSEATIVALIGSAIGLLLGLAFARVMTIAIAFLQGLETPSAPLPPADVLSGALLGVGAGLVVTLGVTLNLARQAGRVSPLVALGQGERARPQRASGLYERWGWIGALGLFAAYLLIHPIAVDAIHQSTNLSETFAQTYLLPFILAGVAILALPGGVRVAIWAFEQIAAHLGIAARLAAGNLTRQRGRATLTTATLAIGLMLVVGLSGITLGQSTLIASNAIDILDRDFLLVRAFPTGASIEQMTNAVAFPPLSPELKADLDALAEEAEVLPLAQVQLPGLSLGPGLNYAYGGDLRMFREVPHYRPVSGSWDEAEATFAAGPALILPEVAARRLNVKPGDAVEVDTLKGKASFKVAMVGGFLPVMTREVAAEYFGAHPFVILVDARPGQAKAALEDQLKALAQKHRLLFTPSPKDFASSLINSVLNLALALFAGLTSLSGIVAGLALVNTLIASVLERQREIGVLRALGLTRTQARALVVIEAGLLGLTGSLIGVLGGLAISVTYGQLSNAMGALMFSRETSGATPQPWAVAGAALVVGPTIAMLAALYPADRAANVNPTEAMRAEGAAGFLKPAAHLGPTGVRGLIVRMPLAAKLSLTLGFLFVLTVAALTAVRVDYERRLLEENVRSILSRGFDFLASSASEQISADITELTPETLAALQQRGGAQADALQAQFQSGQSPYAFGLKYYFVADEQGKVISSDKAEYIGRTLTDTLTFNGPASVVRLTAWTGERAIEAALPIENKAGQRLGSLRIGFSTEPVDNIIQDIVNSSAWTMLAALAIAVSLTVLFTRRALTPIAQIAEASQAVAHGDLTQRVPATRWDEIGRLARAFNDMVKGLGERERLRDLFGRYLSRDVSAEVLAGRVTLHGERKTVTALFCDMRGSTAFAEDHDPEEVMRTLNQYFEVIIRATETHGGIVGRFLGDAALCVFGAPLEQRDHAARAVRAALAMQAGLAQLNAKRAALGQPTLRFGIGVNTGAVTAGATGSEERLEYTVIGDAVNVAARVQEMTKTQAHYDALVSGYTGAALAGATAEFNFIDLGEMPIRGRSERVRVLGLIGKGT